MQVAVSQPHPIVELNGELERPAGGSEHRILVDAEKVIDVADLGDGGLTDPNSADGIRFDNVDLQALAHGTAKDGRGHPSGSAAADDRHTPDAQVAHRHTVPGSAEQFQRPALAPRPAC